MFYFEFVEACLDLSSHFHLSLALPPQLMQQAKQGRDPSDFTEQNLRDYQLEPQLRCLSLLPITNGFLLLKTLASSS